MSGRAALQILLYLGVLTALAVPLGHYIAWVLGDPGGPSAKLQTRLEAAIYRVAGVRTDREMGWKQYAAAVLAFNLVGMVGLYAIQRLQAWLPLDPTQLPGVGPAVAFNTAVSFVTNTNWQAYAGETTLSHFTQMVGLTTQNFASAATGIAVLLALLRGFTRREAPGIGNFWVDLVRSTLYVLLPLSMLLAVALMATGVVQTLRGSVTVALSEPLTTATGAVVRDQVIALGPVASQVAIKQLGTNGGGFFNVNSAHPLENPTPTSNFLEMLAILLIPAALCFSFGVLVGDRRQGWALFAAMLLLFVPLLWVAVASEQAGNPMLAGLGIDASTTSHQVGGNMEGKEVRFGIVGSALWAVATTAASNGSVNAMHDSFTPLGGLVLMWLMQLGEIIFGGVGSGLYGILIYAVIAVFVAGLMVGRTPEYLGKKIEAFEMQMASLVIVLPAATVLVGTAVACLVPQGTTPLGNPAAHGFSEILYAFSSAANNNGSAFAGLDSSGSFYAITLALSMLIGRFGVIVPVLAIAGALAVKKQVPPNAGTLPTHTPLFVGLLAGVIVVVGALTFVPALALGPIVEQATLAVERAVVP